MQSLSDSDIEPDFDGCATAVDGQPHSDDADGS